MRWRCWLCREMWGAHPDSGEMIQAGLGRFGPYLKYQGKYASLPEDDDLMSVGINRAVALLSEAAQKSGRVLGEHPNGGEVHVKKGRYGPYFEHNKLRAPLPKHLAIESVTLEDAVENFEFEGCGTETKTRTEKEKNRYRTWEKIVIFLKRANRRSRMEGERPGSGAGGCS